MTVTGTVAGINFGTGQTLSLYVGGLQLGRRAWRREIATSPWVAGEVEVSAVLDQSHDTLLRFRVKDTTETGLKTQIASLVAAVEAASWTLTVTINGVAWPSMTCTRADTETLFDTPHIRSLVATVLVYTTRSPNAAGPL